ncbi:hypothetical protein D9615_001778 [Tricholomella constricta]|uniref:Uncharacterized protein n=1 Tax=Tricholomella constricta TaxID=117010 RepID=A0A8H5MAY2_9AGAR|nr:hypothetical protein D9615_001778 [Tricholomella constricta]
MPPTLLTSIPYHVQALPTSPSMQMPNVFVVPPEEEDTPAWCCFDANEVPLLTTAPDIPFLDGALSMFQTESQAPIFHRHAAGPFASRNAVLMPRKSLENKSVLDVLMDSEYPESDDEMDLDLDQEVLNDGRCLGNDSEIVEVIKLRRHGDDIQHPFRGSTAKPAKSFKSRASKAFRSIRNVGKRSSRTKPKAQDVFTSSSITGTGELPPRSRTPTMSRRSSAVFSQLFSPQSTIQSRSSVSSFDAPRSSTQSPPPAGYSSSSYCPSPSDAHPGTSLTSSSSLIFDHRDTRSPSPDPSTQMKSNGRRFSMMSLQRIFSFSGDEFSEVTPTCMSRDPTGPSTASSSGPDTPTDESTPLPPNFITEDHGPFTPKPSATSVPALGQGEISFEMRLDSLHFESLSFDADRF